MASVKMLEAFNKKVVKAIVKLGAKPYKEQGHAHRYFIETKAGKLDISLHKEDKPSKIFSIFCCFDDPKKAVEVLSPSNADNLNKHSGKWNYHFRGADGCFDTFMYSLQEII